MNKIINITIEKPFKDQKPGTSGLRKSTLQFQEPHYLEIFVESVLLQINQLEGSTLIVGGDGRYGNKKAIKKIIQICAAHICIIFLIAFVFPYLPSPPTIKVLPFKLSIWRKTDSTNISR